MYKLSRSFFIAVVLVLATVLIAEAGGWAVITLDELPTQITAGQTLPIGFTVRQHGRTLRSDLKPIMRFDRSDGKESFEVTAQRQGAEGHYLAEIKFASAGQWNWWVDIEQFGMVTQPMPTLNVQAAAPTKAMSVQTRLMPLTVVLDVVRAISRMLADKVDTATVSMQIKPLSLVAAQATQADRVALGKELFSAKGCVMCHAHAAVKVPNGPFGFGDVQPPNLSEKMYGAEYLRLWLRDPQAVKPQTQMPNLQLSEGEIEALIAFLQAAH